MTAIDLLKKYMIENNIDNKSLAKQAGVPVELLNRTLNKKRKLKSTEFIEICQVLGLDIKDFIEC